MSPAITKDDSMTENIEKLRTYLTKEYGSIYSFKLIKYFLEHKLARYNDGYPVYELAYNIAPSEILRKNDLIKILMVCDGALEKDAESGLKLLINNNIISCDEKTNVLRLSVPIESITNKYLKETEEGLEIVDNKEIADVIVLPVFDIKSYEREDGLNVLSGIPDVLYKNTLLSLKFY